MSLKLGIIGIIVVAVLGGGVLLLSQEKDSGGSSNNKSKERLLPNLSFVDYTGNTVALADFQGRPLVVNTWAVWCPFCVKELQEFVKLQQEFPEIVVIAIDRAESRTTAKSYTDDIGITQELVFLLDASDSFYKAIGGFSMPETLFVDKNGVVKEHKRGPMDINEMRRRVENIL